MQHGLSKCLVIFGITLHKIAFHSLGHFFTNLTQKMHDNTIMVIVRPFHDQFNTIVCIVQTTVGGELTDAY